MLCITMPTSGSLSTLLDNYSAASHITFPRLKDLSLLRDINFPEKFPNLNLFLTHLHFSVCQNCMPTYQTNMNHSWYCIRLLKFQNIFQRGSLSVIDSTPYTEAKWIKLHTRHSDKVTNLPKSETGNLIWKILHHINDSRNSPHLKVTRRERERGNEKLQEVQIHKDQREMRHSATQIPPKCAVCLPPPMPVYNDWVSAN